MTVVTIKIIAIVVAGMTAVPVSVVVVVVEMIKTGSSQGHSVDGISAQVGSIILLILSPHPLFKF